MDSAILFSANAISCISKAKTENHHTVISLLNHASLLQRDARDFDLALKICGKVLIMNSLKKDKDFKSSTDETTLNLFNMGCIQKDKGDSRKAMTLFQDAIAQQIKLKFNQRDNLLVVQVMLQMADLYEEAGMVTKVEETYKNAIRTLVGRFSKNHVEVARLHHLFGQYYERKHMYDDARFELTEAYNIYKTNKAIHKSHPNIVMLERDLADVKAIIVMQASKDESLFGFKCFSCGDQKVVL